MWGMWLVRMSRWARNPPSPGRVKLVLAVVAICLLIVTLEHFFGTPDWMKVNPRGPRLPGFTN
ncbi:hypothetical protein GLS40_03140 [Pseudooceanicola sp. 216_PA32_1]|uniref:Uncharacterized protein n=2 Tax=Pseudooceanicola pacificus TaxID=2676438 RepID=A0A844W936_9RHOB|nr:hypothetical protein [Pseudooceanicola pacificus]MWB77018.1 hypothetical protein [Pseudooceanicola pacificus]